MEEGILFEQVEDSRQDWKVKHSISEILTVVMCGVSAGERSIYGIREFAQAERTMVEKCYRSQTAERAAFI